MLQPLSSYVNLKGFKHSDWNPQWFQQYSHHLLYTWKWQHMSSIRVFSFINQLSKTLSITSKQVLKRKTRVRATWFYSSPEMIPLHSTDRPLPQSVCGELHDKTFSSPPSESSGYLGVIFNISFTAVWTNLPPRLQTQLCITQCQTAKQQMYRCASSPTTTAEGRTLFFPLHRRNFLFHFASKLVKYSNLVGNKSSHPIMPSLFSLHFATQKYNFAR